MQPPCHELYRRDERANLKKYLFGTQYPVTFRKHYCHMVAKYWLKYL